MQRARLDSLLSARIVARRRLLYRDGPSAALDRPAHVRSASGIAWLGSRLAIIQDDANFVALVDPQSGLADAVALPADARGERLFDDTRGTKHLKLDLEACFAVLCDGRTELVALGSGSERLRERIVVLRHDDDSQSVSDVRVVDASSLYAALRAASEFSGSELNVEGAVIQGDLVLLFQRGNGSQRDGREPVNAIGELSSSALLDYLDSDGTGAVPTLQHVEQYDLGSVAGIPYTFTDATLSGSGRVVFLASAEDSSSAVTDGTVHGTLVGELAADGSARVAALLDERGMPARIKAEGIALDPLRPGRGWVVVDMDDPALASELLEVTLSFAR